MRKLTEDELAKIVTVALVLGFFVMVFVFRWLTVNGY